MFNKSTLRSYVWYEAAGSTHKVACKSIVQPRQQTLPMGFIKYNVDIAFLFMYEL